MAVAKLKKRNAQDSTLRNVRSANKRIKDLTARIEKLEQQAHDLWAQSAKIENIERILADKPWEPRVTITHT